MSQSSLAIFATTVIATAAVAANRFVTIAGGYPAANGNALGVTRTEAATDDAITVDVLGTTIVEASAAIAKGAAVASTVDGQAVTHTTGAVVGRALGAATAAGEKIEILLIAN